MKAILCEIVFLEQAESSVKLEFIQYLKFLVEELFLRKSHYSVSATFNGNAESKSHCCCV